MKHIYIKYQQNKLSNKFKYYFIFVYILYIVSYSITQVIVIYNIHTLNKIRYIGYRNYYYKPIFKM